MPGLFVTATGTEVGKTFVTAGLLRAGGRAGLPMDALKPVMSGYHPDAADISDAGVLLAALGRPVTPEAIASLSPWRFAAPLAPNMAAELEGRTLPFATVAAMCRGAANGERFTLIEGVGGVMAPLDAGRTVLDLIAEISCPIALASGTELGAISHCLTAVAAMTGRGLAPCGILLNESARSTVPVSMTVDTVATFCPDIPIVVVPREPDDAVFDRVFARLATLAWPLSAASELRHKGLRAGVAQW